MPWCALLAVLFFACTGGQAATGTTVSLRDVVASRATVGRRVRVSGRCLTLSERVVRELPPRIRNAWQLEADGVTVFVSGVLPAACSDSRSAGTVTITALVTEDTLPALGDLPPAPRRYLLLIGVTSP